MYKIVLMVTRRPTAVIPIVVVLPHRILDVNGRDGTPAEP